MSAPIPIPDLQAMTTAPELIAAIRSNVDEFWEQRRTYEDFTAHNSALWARAKSLGHVIESRVITAAGMVQRVALAVEKARL